MVEALRRLGHDVRTVQEAGQDALLTLEMLRFFGILPAPVPDGGAGPPS